MIGDAAHLKPESAKSAMDAVVCASPSFLSEEILDVSVSR